MAAAATATAGAGAGASVVLIPSNNKTSTTQPHTEVFRSPNKRFVCRTKIVERDHSVTIQRTLLWYDTIQKKYRKRREIHTYHCCDEQEQQGYEFETFMFNNLY